MKFVVLISAMSFPFLAIAVVGQTPTPTPIETDDVVKISTTLIQIDVSITDKKGNPVTDLRRDEVEIYENGVKQEITNFSFVFANPRRAIEKLAETKDPTIPQPPTRIQPNQIRRTIALVVDDLTLSFESTHFVKQALKDFVDNQMQEGDLVAIIRTGGGIGALQQFTTDKRQLYAAIEKVRWNLSGSGGVGAFAPIESRPPGSDEFEQEDRTIATDENDVDNFREDVFATGTLGAVDYIIRGMRELPGRKSIMLMSDGFRIARVNSRGFSESTRVLDSLKRLIDQANRSSVVVYTMDARGLQTSGFTAQDDLSGRSTLQIQEELADRRNTLFDTQDGLVLLARHTGGIPLINNNDLKGGIRRMVNDQSYYLIGYQPDDELFDPAKRRFNNLEVRVGRKDVNVRYRSGFFGMTDDAVKAPAREMDNSERIVNALTSPFALNDISLNLNSIFKGDSEGKLSVTSFLHIDLSTLNFTKAEDGTRTAAFDLLVMNFGDNGIPIDKISKTFSINMKADKFEELLRDGIVYGFNFPVQKPGAYQMRVAIRDHATQSVGSASQFIEIPKLSKNRLKLSGMVIDNLSYEEWNRVQTAGASTIESSAKEKSANLTPSADTAMRKFKRGTVLNYGFEVYNPTVKGSKQTDLEMRTRVFRNGKLLFEGKTVPVAAPPKSNFKVIPVAGAVNLGTTLEPGDYALQVIVTDKLAKKKRQVTAQFVQFEIVE